MSLRGSRWSAPSLVVVAVGLLLSVADTSRASGAPQRPANPAPASSVVVDRHHVADGQGYARLRVPRVVIAAADGLPASLDSGTAYVLELHVWVAGGESPMTASVDVAGSATNDCARVTLPSATISAIHCQVLPLASGANTIVVNVKVGPQQAPVATAMFTHAVTPSKG